MKYSTSITTGSCFTILLLSLCNPAMTCGGGLAAAWGDGSYGDTTLPAGTIGIRAIAAGSWHNLALRGDGTVVGWGANWHGQSSVPPGLSNVIAISAGQDQSLALKANGTVVAWGANFYVQTNVPSGLSNVTAIAAGDIHNLALRADGTVVAWGDNSFGQTSVPSGLSGVIAIAAGYDHSLALRADGTVVGWGDNSYGQTDIPVDLANVIAIAAGEEYSLALKADGTVAAWGWNYYGQTSVPQSLTNVMAIAAGGSFSVALRTDGAVIAWGASGSGETKIPAGLVNATSIAAGEAHGLALVASGPIRILRDPQSQAVAYNSNVTFTVVADGAPTLSYQWFLNGVALVDDGRITGSTNATLTVSTLQLADAGVYTVIVGNPFGSISSAGAALTVIKSPFILQQPSSLTAGAGADVSLSVSVEGTPPLIYQWLFNGQPLPGATNNFLNITNVQQATSGSYAVTVTNTYGAALSSAATLTVTDTPPFILLQPTQPVYPTLPVGEGTTLRVVARGSQPFSYQWRFNGDAIPGATNASLALNQMRFDQSGYYNVVVTNLFGEVISVKVFLNVAQASVWNGGNYGYYSPMLPTNIPPGLSNMVAVAAGDSHVLALNKDGTLVAWGVYKCGMATNIPADATDVIAISAGGNSSMALKADGTVRVWGDNTYGATNVPQALSNVIAIADGGFHCLAVKSNGTVVGWGNNNSGQATPPPTLSNVVAVAAGDYHSLALTADGHVVAWGSSTSFPFGVPWGLSNVIAIAAGNNYSMALKADDTVVGWGGYRKFPLGWSNAVAVAQGNVVSAALKADGTVFCLGVPSPTNLIPLGISNVIALAIGSAFESFSVSLVGDGSPFMTIQPVSQTVPRSAAVQLHARAVGAPPLRYQWQLDGEDLPGATNGDLTITNVQGGDTGKYQVLVGNDLGHAVSRAAQLSIPFDTNLPAALDATNLVWTTWSVSNGIVNPGANGWFVQNQVARDGDVAAQSGLIGNNQQSVLQTTVTVPGTLTFWWKVSSEEGYDFLSFFDGDSLTPLARISGETGWQQMSLHIASGPQLLKWVYSKDVQRQRRR